MSSIQSPRPNIIVTTTVSSMMTQTDWLVDGDRITDKRMKVWQRPGMTVEGDFSVVGCIR